MSGIVALVRAAHPELDAANVIQRMIATARDAGDAGADPIYGFGLVDAFAAVTADVPAVDANPMGDLQDWIRLHRRADSTPVPVPTGAPTQTPPPAIAGPVDPTGTLLPSVNQLRDAGLPLLVFTVFAGALVTVGLLAVRRFRGHRQPR